MRILPFSSGPCTGWTHQWRRESPDCLIRPNLPVAAVKVRAMVALRHPRTPVEPMVDALPNLREPSKHLCLLLLCANYLAFRECWPDITNTTLPAASMSENARTAM